MRDFNGNAEKSNAARVAYDLELELIDRDLGLDPGEVVDFLNSEDEPARARAASLLRRAWREFEWRRHYAQHSLRGRR